MAAAPYDSAEAGDAAFVRGPGRVNRVSGGDADVLNVAWPHSLHDPQACLVQLQPRGERAGGSKPSKG